MDIYRLPKESTMTLLLLQEFLDKHMREVNDRYKKLKAAYESDHDILHQAVKPAYKPDNRIVVNFPKYITDTMNGFFIGNPIKTVADDKAVSDFVEFLEQYNDQDDNNAELSKMKKDLFNLRFQHVTGQLENPIKMRETKRDIARVKTIIREKELAKVQG